MLALLSGVRAHPGSGISPMKIAHIDELTTIGKNKVPKKEMKVPNDEGCETRKPSTTVVEQAREQRPFLAPSDVQ